MTTTDLPRAAYSVPETARAFGCSANHIRTLIRQGTIPAIRLGERNYVPADFVDSFRGDSR